MPRSYKPFVSCRVSEIQSNSNPADWYHCPTAENVADDLTRGITPKELNGRWVNCPSFLTLPEEQWINRNGYTDAQEINKEKRKVTVTCPVTVAHPIFDVSTMPSGNELLELLPISRDSAVIYVRSITTRTLNRNWDL
jgi:hypothetical protein